MRRILIASAIVLSLVGCKSEVVMPASYNEVFGEPQEKVGLLIIEVPTCKDGNLDSNSVLKAKQKVGYIFPKAQYLGCKEENFDSYTEFNIPFTAGGIGMKDCKADQICVASSQNNRNMNVFFGAEIRQKFKEATENEITKFDPKDFEITVVLRNDTGTNVVMDFPSVFVAEEKAPFHAINGIDVKKDANFSLTLSNVGSAAVFSRGVATVATFPKRELVKITEQPKK